ncbi:hypothetical protein Osc2_17320 [Ruminococcus sp. 25CYCFAH16]|mgnify:FL=1|jgi:hypothetical protein
MSEFNQLRDRVDKLTLAYMEKTCDISSLSVEEFTKKYIDISEEINKVLKENKPKSKTIL